MTFAEWLDGGLAFVVLLAVLAFIAGVWWGERTERQQGPRKHWRNGREW